MLQLHLSDQQFNCLLKCVLYYRLDGSYIPFEQTHCIFFSFYDFDKLLQNRCDSSASALDQPISWAVLFNTLRPRQNGRHIADDIFKRIFLNENIWIPIKISLKFVPKGPIDTIPALVPIMAWRRLRDKPLSEPMIGRLPTHICVTRPQWVNPSRPGDVYMHQ